MKVENTSALFEPIELTVTIESKEELQVLWHRLNVVSELRADPDPSVPLPENLSVTRPLWDRLNTEVRQRGLRK